jgi:hypothetical protein
LADREDGSAWTETRSEEDKKTMTTKRVLKSKADQDVDAFLVDVSSQFIWGHDDESEDASTTLSYAIERAEEEIERLEELQEQLLPFAKPGVTLRAAVAAYLKDQS